MPHLGSPRSALGEPARSAVGNLDHQYHRRQTGRKGFPTSLVRTARARTGRARLLTACVWSGVILASGTRADTDSAGELTFPEEILANYAAIVHASYSDSLTRAKALRAAVDAFLERPTEESLKAARRAWLSVRPPYCQSEAYRFYGGPIDGAQGPEGLLNAWPVDEAYIDYVQGAADAGVINNPKRYPAITEALLVKLNEKDGEANISTGFHAIEFLLWGQDLYEDSPGRRPASDYVDAPNAERRRRYLRIVTERLIRDLESLVAAWAPGEKNYRSVFLALPVEQGLSKVMTGLGMMSGFELSEERLFVPFTSMDQEDEHSCFSDGTHSDILANAMGLQNVFESRYTRLDGSVLGGGASLYELVEDLDSELAERTKRQIRANIKLCRALEPPFDQLIAGKNHEGRARVKELIDSMRLQTRLIAQCARSIGLSINL